MIEMDGGGLRYNDNKPLISLIPPEQILGLAQHYTKGAEKYAEDNWLRGMPWNNCYNSLMRHALAWADREDFDAETGSHHMVAVAWNALALYTYAIRGLGEDNRRTYQRVGEDNRNSE